MRREREYSIDDEYLDEFLHAEYQLHQQLLKLRHRINMRYRELEEQKLIAETSRPERILLRELLLHDPIVSKWRLGKGLSHPSHMNKAPVDQSAPTTVPQALTPGQLRLFGILSSGLPWQCCVALAELEQVAEGYIIGSDEKLCSICIRDKDIPAQHLRLSIHKGIPLLSGISAESGYFIDGVAIAPYSQNIPLCDGMIIELGELQLLVEIC